METVAKQLLAVFVGRRSALQLVQERLSVLDTERKAMLGTPSERAAERFLAAVAALQDSERELAEANERFDEFCAAQDSRVRVWLERVKL